MKKQALFAVTITGILLASSAVQAESLKERAGRYGQQTKKWAKKHKAALIGAGVATGGALTGAALGGATVRMYKPQQPLPVLPDFTLNDMVDTVATPILS